MKGSKYVIEWYFDSNGKSKAKCYFDELTDNRQRKILHLLAIMGQMGKINNEEKFRSEGDQIYAFKPTPDRFLCFFSKGAKIMITNDFEKKTSKMPAREKERSLKYKEDYVNRFNRDDYYE